MQSLKAQSLASSLPRYTRPRRHTSRALSDLLSDTFSQHASDTLAQPPEFSLFLGPAKAVTTPFFATVGDKWEGRSITHRDAERLRENRALLPYANPEYAFGPHSPLNPALLRLLVGDALIGRGNGGQGGDIIPSPAQYKRQMMPQAISDGSRNTVSKEDAATMRGAIKAQKKLQANLARAIKEERYADAAKIWDTITAKHQERKQGLFRGSDPFGVKNILGEDRLPAKAVVGAYSGKPIGDGEARGLAHKNLGAELVRAITEERYEDAAKIHMQHEKEEPTIARNHHSLQAYTWEDELGFRHTYDEGRGPNDGHFVGDPVLVGSDEDADRRDRHTWVEGQGFFAGGHRLGNGNGEFGVVMPTVAGYGDTGDIAGEGGGEAGGGVAVAINDD